MNKSYIAQQRKLTLARLLALMGNFGGDFTKDAFKPSNKNRQHISGRQCRNYALSVMGRSCAKRREP